MKTLVVDDNAANRYLLEVLLKTHGHKVVSAVDGVEALAQLRREPFDLIISDILMPRMDGYRLCRELKQDERLRAIPFIFITSSYVEEKDEQFALSLGADRFVRRPTEPDALMAIINDLIAQGTTASPTLAANGGYLAAYAERVVHKLEQKIAALENEIAARKRAETALRESEEKFRSFAEAADQVFWITTLKPVQVVYANPSFERIWGRGVEDLYADPHRWLEAVHPDDQARVAEAFERWLDGLPDARYDVEYRIVTPTGAIRWISDCGFVIPSQSEGAVRVAGIAEDITERKQVEEALRESEERYRSLTAALVEGVILMDVQGIVRTCNTSAERLLELKIDAAADRCIFDPRFPPIDESGKEYVADVYPHNVSLRTGQAQRGVIMGLRRPNGGVTWLSVNTQPLLHPGSTEPYAVVASFTDVTERKLLEQELQQQARRDPLTGVANRRHFMGEAEQHLALSRRYGHTLSLLMLDIDRFKSINDTYGHHVGDLALQALTRTCEAELRDVDVFGRIGGEEFAVLLPETRTERALRVAERLRKAVAGTMVRVEPDRTMRFTVSIGVATTSDEDQGIDDLLQHADQALYEAKEAGRNAVRVADVHTRSSTRGPRSGP